MHLKQITRQNQRIERITESTLIVGIDIAKELHAAQAVDFRGRILSGQACSFGNDRKGFETLGQWIKRLQSTHKKDDVIIGMESTGHYWFRLADWLTQHGYDVAIVSPTTTKRNKENRDNSPSKNDPKDALVIGECVSRGYYTPYRPQDEAFRSLYVLMSNREGWVRKLTRVKNQIHRWLDLYFPEFRLVFPEVDGTRALATLREFPTPNDLLGLTSMDVIKGWGKHMQRPGGSRGQGKARGLLQYAKGSVSKDISWVDVGRHEIAYLLDEFDRIRTILDKYQTLAEQMLSDLPGAEILQSVGLSPTLAAAVLAFSGDLRNFEHGNQLLRKAGLNLAERQSGKYKGAVKISKRGSAPLRKYFYLSVLHLLQTNPVFRSRHRFNTQNKGMAGIPSMMKLIGKLARMLVAMVQQGEHFCAQKATANQPAA